jgi:hypothetical protein
LASDADEFETYKTKISTTEELPHGSGIEGLETL